MYATKMENKGASASRAFPLIAATLALLYNALTAVLCTYLPRDSMIVGYGASGYAIAGTAFSMLGVYGIVTRRSYPVTVFSHFLLVDALVAATVRLIILELFFNTTHSQDTCSNIVEAIWTSQQHPSHATVTSPGWQQSLTDAGIWCRFALGAVHVVSLGVLVCTSAAQGTVALAIRSYGKQLGQHSWNAQDHGRVEYFPGDEADSSVFEKA